MGKGKRDRGGDRGDSGWASITWAQDGRTFKIEQDGVGITDDNVENWISTVHRELSSWPDAKGFACSSLSLAKNDLTDTGVQKIMHFFVQTRISVQMLKLFKNSFGDPGMQAIGEFIQVQAKSEPVQEIHLSHNKITWRGALAVFEAVKDCGHYPCQRGKDGTPLWLRMENNYIDWDPVTRQLDLWGMRMSIGENRDSWKSDAKRDRREVAECPLVAMHHSYCHQRKDMGSGRGDEYEWQEDDYADWDGGDGYDYSHREPPRRRDRERDRDRDRDRQDRDRDRHERDRDRTGGPVATAPTEGRRRDRDRGQGGAPEWSGHEGKEDEHAEVAAMRRYIDKQLHSYTNQQEKKFKLVFELLKDLQETQSKLEHGLQEMTQQQMHQMMQHQAQAPQQFAVQMMQVPVDGGGQPQNWGADRRPSNVVW